ARRCRRRQLCAERRPTKAGAMSPRLSGWHQCPEGGCSLCAILPRRFYRFNSNGGPGGEPREPGCACLRSNRHPLVAHAGEARGRRSARAPCTRCLAYSSSSALITDSPEGCCSRNPARRETCFIATLSGRISPDMAARRSSRPIFTSRFRSKIPSPRFCHGSPTTRANSAAFEPDNLISRPTPMISRSPLPRNQRHLAVIVYEAEPRQPLMGDALLELQELEITAIDAACREHLVKVHHQGFVLGADRADRY